MSHFRAIVQACALCRLQLYDTSGYGQRAARLPCSLSFDVHALRYFVRGGHGDASRGTVGLPPSSLRIMFFAEEVGVAGREEATATKYFVLRRPVPFV